MNTTNKDQTALASQNCEKYWEVDNDPAYITTPNVEVYDAKGKRLEDCVKYSNEAMDQYQNAKGGTPNE